MNSSRDLLVLSKKASSSQSEMDWEVEMLHQLLYQAESLENFCIANEIVDLNRYKVIQNAAKIKRIIQAKIKPFQFISNKN